MLLKAKSYFAGVALLCVEWESHFVYLSWEEETSERVWPPFTVPWSRPLWRVRLTQRRQQGPSQETTPALTMAPQFHGCASWCCFESYQADTNLLVDVCEEWTCFLFFCFFIPDIYLNHDVWGMPNPMSLWLTEKRRWSPSAEFLLARSHSFQPHTTSPRSAKQTKASCWPHCSEQSTAWLSSPLTDVHEHQR